MEGCGAASARDQACARTLCRSPSQPAEQAERGGGGGSIRVKTRPGFAQLDPDQAHRVLRPITEAQVDTTAEAISPTLVEVRDRFTSRIRQAEDAANDLLDEELANRSEDRPVVKIESRLRGREIASREQLQAVVAELEERIGAELDQGHRVRIV